MRGIANEAVVLHCELAITKQMRRDWLARRVKSADYKNNENEVSDRITSLEKNKNVGMGSDTRLISNLYE